MESSEEQIRAAKSCPLPFVDMGFLQQYVQETYSDKGAYWMDEWIHIPFILQFYTACYIGNAPVSGLSVELNYTVKHIVVENYWNAYCI